MLLLPLSKMTDSQLKQVVLADESDDLSFRAGEELRRRRKEKA